MKNLLLRKINKKNKNILYSDIQRQLTNGWFSKKEMWMDTYVLIMILSGLPSECWFFNGNFSLTDYGNYQINKNIQFKILPNYKNLTNLNKKFDTVFVRGDYKEWNFILKKISYKKLYFYSATSSHIVPNNLNYKPDVIFSDNLNINSRENKIIEKPVYEKVFKPCTTKDIDICFIASWAPHKRYTLLKKIIEEYKAPLNITVVASTFRGNRKTVEAWGKSSNKKLELYENIPKHRIGKILNRSKILFVSSKQDCNPRTINEALACNTPILVMEDLMMGKRHINNKTGIISSSDDLLKNINYLLNNYDKINPIKYYKETLSYNILGNYYKELFK